MVWGYLYQNVPIFPLYILSTRVIKTFWSKGIDKFLFGSNITVCAYKLYKKYHQYSQKFLELYQLLINNFLCQTVPIILLYILSKLLTTWLTQLCVTKYPNSFMYDLAYTTRTNLILWLILKYKKLLKFVNITSYLHLKEPIFCLRKKVLILSQNANLFSSTFESIENAPPVKVFFKIKK